METKYKAGLSILGISSLALLTVATVFNTSRVKIFTSVRGDNTKTTTVTQSMLDATTLYDYDLGGPNGKDSKFSINLGGGRYMDGAIIYRDCARQFVGDYLGDRFGIHNNSSVEQAYNFNFLFNVNGNVESFTVDYSVYMQLESGGEGIERCCVQLKCTQIYTDFYSFLEAKSSDGKYEELHRKADSVDSNPNFTWFRLTGYHYETDSTVQPDNFVENQQAAFTFKESANTKNLVAVQFTYYSYRTETDFIKPYKWLRFKLNKLVFTHSCL